MNKNNFEFNVVSIDQRNSESLVVFEINKVSSIVRKTNVGQYVKSKPFELNYPTSIGKSKWNIILFLNGQYEHGGMPNDVICIYLKMLHCEQQSSAFKFDVKFQLGINCATETKKNQSVCFNNVRTRWIGTKLINTNEMILKGSRYIQNDTLFLSVHLNENFPKHLSVETFPEASYNNNNLIERESYAKSGNDFKSTNTPRIPSPSSNHRFSNQSNTVAVYDNYLYNSPQNVSNSSTQRFMDFILIFCSI